MIVHNQHHFQSLLILGNAIKALQNSPSFSWVTHGNRFEQKNNGKDIKERSSSFLNFPFCRFLSPQQSKQNCPSNPDWESWVHKHGCAGSDPRRCIQHPEISYHDDHEDHEDDEDDHDQNQSRCSWLGRWWNLECPVALFFNVEVPTPNATKESLANIVEPGVQKYNNHH